MARPTVPHLRRAWRSVAVSALAVTACAQGGNQQSIMRPAAPPDQNQPGQVRVVAGVVWIDADGDGVRSADEPAPSGSMRVLATDGYSTSASAFTDDDGRYSITVIGDGDLLIEAGDFDSRFGFTTPRTLTWPDGEPGAPTFDFGLDVVTVSGAV